MADFTLILACLLVAIVNAPLITSLVTWFITSLVTSLITEIPIELQNGNLNPDDPFAQTQVEPQDDHCIAESSLPSPVQQEASTTSEPFKLRDPTPIWVRGGKDGKPKWKTNNKPYWSEPQSWRDQFAQKNSAPVNTTQVLRDLSTAIKRDTDSLSSPDEISTASPYLRNEIQREIVDVRSERQTDIAHSAIASTTLPSEHQTGNDDDDLGPQSDQTGAVIAKFKFKGYTPGARPGVSTRAPREKYLTSTTSDHTNKPLKKTTIREYLDKHSVGLALTQKSSEQRISPLVNKPKSLAAPQVVLKKPSTVPDVGTTILDDPIETQIKREPECVASPASLSVTSPPELHMTTKRKPVQSRNEPIASPAPPTTLFPAVVATPAPLSRPIKPLKRRGVRAVRVALETKLNVQTTGAPSAGPPQAVRAPEREVAPPEHMDGVEKIPHMLTLPSPTNVKNSGALDANMDDQGPQGEVIARPLEATPSERKSMASDVMEGVVETPFMAALSQISRSSQNDRPAPRLVAANHGSSVSGKAPIQNQARPEMRTPSVAQMVEPLRKFGRYLRENLNAGKLRGNGTSVGAYLSGIEEKMAQTSHDLRCAADYAIKYPAEWQQSPQAQAIIITDARFGKDMWLGMNACDWVFEELGEGVNRHWIMHLAASCKSIMTSMQRQR